MKIPWWRCWRWMAGNGSLRFPVRVLIFHVQEESNDEGPGKDGKVEPESREWRFSSKCENAKYERQRLKLWWNQMYVYLLSKLVKTDQYCPRKAEKSKFSTAYIYLVCEPFVVCSLFWRPDLLLKIYIQTTPNLVQNYLEENDSVKTSAASLSLHFCDFETDNGVLVRHLKVYLRRIIHYGRK